MATTIKRGNDFYIQGPVMVNGVLTDLTGWSARSQIRSCDPLNTLLQELTVSIVDGPAALVRLQATNVQTRSWALGPAELDIELTDPANVHVSTPTLYLTIAAGVTHD
jgi:hypothetical protein